MSDDHPSAGPTWIFGYGSLMWKPGFPYRGSHHAVVRGWQRRFWQGSTDHRGVPGSPGRVVTLVPEPHATCEGIAFAIDEGEASSILSMLDHREKGGYRRSSAVVTLAGGESVTATLYVADATNPEYLGPAPLEEVARQIARSTGPSGANLEYVLELAEALRRMNIRDVHVFQLEQLLRSGELAFDATPASRP